MQAPKAIVQQKGGRTQRTESDPESTTGRQKGFNACENQKNSPTVGRKSQGAATADKNFYIRKGGRGQRQVDIS